jgi:hypothetical protein
VCRKSGLENARRCGWLGYVDEPNGPPVWARKNVTLHTCPKSFVTSESQALVEEFLVRRRLGVIDIRDLGAKQVEAFALLERALTAEVRDGQQNGRAVT